MSKDPWRLKNYLIERHRHRSRRKRAPDATEGRVVLELDRDDPRVLAISGETAPDVAFDKMFAHTQPFVEALI